MGQVIVQSPSDSLNGRKIPEVWQESAHTQQPRCYDEATCSSLDSFFSGRETRPTV